MSTERLIASIRIFLRDHCYIMTDEHKYKVMKYLSNLITEKNYQLLESKHGKHYSNCPWADNDCEEGPDTCACQQNDMSLHELFHILDFYQKVLLTRLLKN